MNFENKVVVITGAGRGLGAELARKLAAKKAKVILVARSENEIKELSAELRKLNSNIFHFSIDVSLPDASVRLSEFASAVAGPIDILINNASTLGDVPLRPLLDTRDEVFTHVLETNLLAPFRLMRANLGQMILRGSGIVLNISSDAAVNAYPNWGAYGVSKAALAHLTKSFEAELGETGVHFLSVDPGEMDTKMHEDAIPEANKNELEKPENVAIKIIEIMEKLS